MAPPPADLPGLGSPASAARPSMAGLSAAHKEAVLKMEQSGWAATQWHAGFTLLHWAAKHGSVEWCEYFLALGANGSLRDDRGKNPAEYAAAKGHADVYAFLSKLSPKLSPRAASPRA